MRLIFIFTALAVYTFSMNAQEELNRTWFLTSLTMDGELQEIPEDYFPNLELNTNSESSSQIMGSSICNSYSGEASFTENTITIDFVGETLVDCGFSFDQLFISFFRNSDENVQILSYQIEDQEFLSNDSLTLINDREEIAVFEKSNPQLPEEITQESWYLDYLEIDGIIMDYPTFDPMQYQQFSISEFSSSGDLLQSFTCQEGSETEFSTYYYNGQTYISIAEMYLLALDCGTIPSRQFDYDFHEQLNFKDHTYEITEEGQGRRLILTDDNGDRIFYTNAFLSTQDINSFPSISVYPNPASEILVIETGDQFLPTTVEIYNLQGQKVAQSPFNSEINISALSSGLYFLKLNGGIKESILRFLKK